MPEVIKTYTQAIPATRFIGKKFGDADRVNGGFGKQWGDAFAGGWFEAIETAANKQSDTMFEDGGAYIGLMRSKEGEPFQYWVGMFTPTDTSVPDGFESVDFPASTVGIAWLRGDEKSGEIYGKEPMCMEAMNQNGIQTTPQSDGTWWVFERYACPRFTTPDENGKVTLDIGFFAKA